MPIFSSLAGLEVPEKFVVVVVVVGGGGGWWWVVVETYFSVQLKSRPS